MSDKLKYFIEAWEMNGVGQTVATVQDSPGTVVTITVDDLRALLARQPAAIGNEADDDIEEAREILENMVRSIELDGNYSTEATCTFLRQALNCLPVAAPLANEASKPAPSVEQDERGVFAEYRRGVKEAFHIANMIHANRQGRTAEETCSSIVRVLAEMVNSGEARAASTSANVARLTPDAKGTDAARRYLADLLRNENGSNQYADYIRHELAGDFAWELVNRLLSPNLAQGAEKLCTICNGYGRYQDGNSGTEADGYAPNIVECECTDEERRHEYRDAASPAQHKSGWHPDFVTALYDNADPDKRYTMDQMREYADAFHRSRIDAANVAQGAEAVTEDISLVRELQKALFYWMPRIAGEDSPAGHKAAEHAYLLIGLDDNSTECYGDQARSSLGIVNRELERIGIACSDAGCPDEMEVADFIADLYARAQAATVASTDDARECLADVVSHYRALYAGLAFQLNEAAVIEDSDDMTYWKHEIKALERMYAQAERALTAAPPAQTALTDAARDAVDQWQFRVKDVGSPWTDISHSDANELRDNPAFELRALRIVALTAAQAETRND